MDKIINILLLVIIFVFDPLAVALVVAANFAWFQAFPRVKYKENLYGETVEDKPKKHVEITEEDIHEELFSRNDNDYPLRYTEEDEKRMDIIGQNGNDGEHYEEQKPEIKVNVDKSLTLTGRDGKERDLEAFVKDKVNKALKEEEGDTKRYM